MDKFTLKSAPLCFAPGIIRAAHDTWDANPEWAEELVSCWTDDKRVHKAIREGNYTVSGDTVTVEVPESYIPPEWCMEAARIITNFRDDSGRKLETRYGKKTLQGVADIIYRKWEESKC